MGEVVRKSRMDIVQNTVCACVCGRVRACVNKNVGMCAWICGYLYVRSCVCACVYFSHGTQQGLLRCRARRKHPPTSHPPPSSTILLCSFIGYFLKPHHGAAWGAVGAPTFHNNVCLCVGGQEHFCAWLHTLPVLLNGVDISSLLYPIHTDASILVSTEPCPPQQDYPLAPKTTRHLICQVANGKVGRILMFRSLVMNQGGLQGLRDGLCPMVALQQSQGNRCLYARSEAGQWQRTNPDRHT